MKRNEAIIAAAIGALAIAILAWAYVNYNSNLVPLPQIQPSPAGTSTIPQANLPDDLVKDWKIISAKLPMQAGESGRWYINAIRMISANTALIAFEDGLNGHVAVITHNGTDYEVKKTYQNQLQFTAAELDAIQKEFGDAAYAPKDFRISEGDGRPVPSETNLMLKSPSATMNVKIAWLNPEGDMANQVKAGDISGCDHVVLQNRVVPKTPAPLTAALNALLADKTVWSADKKLYNYLGQGNLKLASASITNGTAKINLTGTPPPLAGVCDDPRLFIQVAQTARQFPSVQNVFLWVNGVLQNQPPDVDMSA